MSARDEILKAIRAQRPPAAELPSLEADWIEYADPTAQFLAALETVGGRGILVPSIDALETELAALPPWENAKKRVSLVDGIAGNVDPQTLAAPHDVEDVDIAILPGRFAVAENAAVWVDAAGVPQRVLYFLPQHLALIVPHDEVVSNMHEAYRRLSFDEMPYGCFISGPSKTADIEQSLVIGAHGARSLTVFVCGV